ncbi:MAG: hypothetical protein J6X55_18035 [Victivallales bacterium]|nr:hypothetical protein [Victivallales bacterium]
MSEGKGTSSELRASIQLLFAVGGEVLAFYELRTLSQLLNKHVQGFPDITNEELRDALYSWDEVTTSNGNYFTCHDEHLNKVAMEFFGNEENGKVVLHIARSLPYQNTDGMPNPMRLARDIRNTLFAKDSKLHRKYLEILGKEQPADFSSGKPYWFLADEGYIGWLGTLPVELFSVCIRQLVPYMIYRLKPINALLEMALSKYQQLYAFARFPVIDILIMAGRLDEAEKLLDDMLNGDVDTIQTRKAWIDFIRGNNAECLASYGEALENIRRPNYGTDYYFTTVTGIFYVLARIKANSPTSLGTAFSDTRIAKQNLIFTKTYSILHEYLNKIVMGASVRDDFLECEPGTLDCIIASMVAFWLYDGQLDSRRLTALTVTRDMAFASGFRWFGAECDEIMRRLSADWIPLPKDGIAELGIVPLVDCVKILPFWTQELNAVSSDLAEFTAPKLKRMAWLVSFSPECPSNVVLDLYEQHLTKTDKWSKGHHVYIERLARDLASGGSWPLCYSAQDIRAVKMLISMSGEAAALQMGSSIRPDQITYNDVLLNLMDYPRLFWADDSEQVPVKIVLDEPYVKITREENGKIRLTIFPTPDDKSYLAAVKHDDNTLHLYCFRQIHKKLADSFKEGILIPEQAVDRINDSCLQLARVMRIISDLDLENMAMNETRVMETQAVMRLERRTSGFSVELLMQPFGEEGMLRLPGEGPQAIIDCHEGHLVKKLRDKAHEENLVAQILDICKALTSFNMVSPFHWKIENGESVFQFMMQLRNIMNLCKVLWKQDRKIQLSRRITCSDVAMRTQQVNNWLDVDGDIVVNENLTVSFQRLLVLSREQKGNFITLDDGQVISLADDFRKSLDNFNNIGQQDKKGRIQFNSLALPVLQALLSDYTNLTLADEWKERLKRIDEAASIDISKPLPLAPGIVLRDYQIEGVRWLLRLDHWGAGACLADDMGLGKTVQAIAFMLTKASEGPCLVVAPTSVCANWVDEIAKFAPSLKAVVFGQGDRESMLRAMKPGMVMISSYGLLQSQISCFEKADWRVVVLDEAQAIKNYQAKRSQAALKLNAKFRIATTGTPIENNLGELWTLFQFITPGLFGSRKSFQDRFTNPIERDKDGNVMQHLNNLIKPFLLRRKKDEVLRELPPKTEVQLHVDLSVQERAFYEAVRLNLLKELEERVDENVSQKRIRILAAIMKLRQAACNPLLIEPGTKVPSAKLDEFKSLVQELVAGGHKTLVFSQFVKHLDIIRPCISNLGITYEYLDGSTPPKEREDAVRNFQEGHSDLFLISLRAGGLGLNLTRADYVIILDPWWNPAVEDQAADRAHRLGQIRPVTIYRIIARNTIEDKIIELHKQKQELAMRLLDGADTAGAISADELLKLLQDTHD